jgi:hypothetical protein
MRIAHTTAPHISLLLWGFFNNHIQAMDTLILLEQNLSSLYTSWEETATPLDFVFQQQGNFWKCNVRSKTVTGIFETQLKYKTSCEEKLKIILEYNPRYKEATEYSAYLICHNALGVNTDPHESYIHNIAIYNNMFVANIKNKFQGRFSSSTLHDTLLTTLTTIRRFIPSPGNKDSNEHIVPSESLFYQQIYKILIGLFNYPVDQVDTYREKFKEFEKLFLGYKIFLVQTPSKLESSLRQHRNSIAQQAETLHNDLIITAFQSLSLIHAELCTSLTKTLQEILTLETQLASTNKQPIHIMRPLFYKRNTASWGDFPVWNVDESIELPKNTPELSMFLHNALKKIIALN